MATSNMITDDQFYCTQCGRKGLPIIRHKGKAREAGHLKKIFCLTCQKETNHVEVRPHTRYTFEDFKTEFEYGNFTEDGQRKRKYGELRNLIYGNNIEKTQTLCNDWGSRIG